MQFIFSKKNSCFNYSWHNFVSFSCNYVFRFRSNTFNAIPNYLSFLMTLK